MRIVRHELVNPLMLKRFKLEIVVWIYDTFDNNFGIQNDFTKDLMESCWHYSE